MQSLDVSTEIPSSIPTSATAPLNTTSSIVAPSSDIQIDTNPNLDSIDSSSGWGSHEHLSPEATSPTASNNNDFNFGNRPMVGSPIMGIVKSTYHKHTHGKFGSFPTTPVTYKAAGISVNVLFPGFSSHEEPSQDVYTIEPPPSKHHIKSVQGKVHVPLTYTIGSGNAAQTVGPMNVRIVASQ